MERIKSLTKNSDQKTLSVFQANEFFVNKILSRNSSVGSSSRSYHCRLVGTVPFKWEVKPGKSKFDSPEAHFVPPVVGLPPAASSLGIARPNNAGPLRNRRVWLWRKFSMSYKVKKNKKVQAAAEGCNGLELKLDHEGHELRKSDLEDMGTSSCGSSSSSNYNSSSAASSTTSEAFAHFRHSKNKIQNMARGFIRWAF